MDRLHVHLHLAALASFLAVAACGDDTTEVPDPAENTERACARPYAWGHWDDGTMRTIGTDRHVCLCITEEEFESGTRLAELNAMILAECNQQAEKYDFAWTECQMWHDEKLWIGENGDNVTWPTDYVIYPPGVQLVCQ